MGCTHRDIILWAPLCLHSAVILLRAMVISHPLLISNVLYAKAIEDVDF